MIQLAKPMVNEQNMKGPLYRAAPPQMSEGPTLTEELKQRAISKAVDKGQEALLEKAGAKTVGAAGAAMGDPTGGVATEVAVETAMPFLKQLLGGLFNKGGYVNGPLSMTGISKVKYKQSGGKVAEEIEINYGGPLSNKGV